MYNLVKIIILSIFFTFNIFAHDMQHMNMEHMKKNETEVQQKLNIDSTNSYNQKICPVMGGKIDTTLYYDYKGKRVYVCCKMCLKKLQKEPQKYIDKLEKENKIKE